MERREFFRSLIAGGASVGQRPVSRNRREHHQNEILYRGSMAIPERIANIIVEHPGIRKTTCRHLVMRYAEIVTPKGCQYTYGPDKHPACCTCGFDFTPQAWTWIFRTQIPAHRLMIREIVRTPEGRLRVHCWSAADPERYTRQDEPTAIVAAKPAKLEMSSTGGAAMKTNTTIWNYAIEETAAGAFRVTEADCPWAKGCGEYPTLEAAQAAVPSPEGFVWEDSQSDDGRYVGTMVFE